jgi:hypothetical protein
MLKIGANVKTSGAESVVEHGSSREDIMRRFGLSSAGFGALFLLSGCVSSNLGNLGFDDNESPIQPDAGQFAVGDIISLEVSILDNAINRAQVAAFQVISSDEAVVVVEAALADQGDGTFNLTATVVGEGSAQVQVRNGEEIIDFIDIQSDTATGVELEPLRFGGLSGFTFGNEGTINVFDSGDAFFVTRLLSDPTNPASDLKGQIDGNVSDEGVLAINPVDVVFIDDTPFQLGERFLNGFFDLVPDTRVQIHGDNPGLEKLFFEAAETSFLSTLNVNVVDLDSNAFEINALTPDTSAGPVGSGFLSGEGVLVGTNEPVFGGHFVFTEVTPGLDLIDIAPFSTTDDIVSFSAKAAGTVEIAVDLVNPDLLDANGNPTIVASQIVAFDVVVQ